MTVNKKIIIAALISSKIDKEEFLDSIRTTLIKKGNGILSEIIQRRGVSRSKKAGGSKNMNAPLNPKTFLGSGKILELKKEVEDKKPELVLFLNELSDQQIANIEEIIECDIEIFTK